jgi:tRNA G18 (ribose-2'-O)-methylase SpoU
MVTDRYLNVSHHPSVDDFASRSLPEATHIIGVDNLPGAVPLERYELPERTCLVFGSEGPGLTEELVAVVQQLVAITQYGSTRSLNAGAAGRHRDVSTGHCAGRTELVTPPTSG